MKVCILGGLGQVGSALHRILVEHHEVIIEDLSVTAVPQRVEFLHVAIPWQARFIGSVLSCANKHEADFIINHSTVPVGTTRYLGKSAVHSPVRGQHNDLENSLRKFLKYVGPNSEEAGKAASLHLCSSLGAVAELMPNSETSELAKLLCSARFLSELAYYEMAEQLCRQANVDFSVAVRRWTSSYNEGYEGTKFKRAELEPPRGKVGGHCVMQNSEMLNEQAGSALLSGWIAEFKK